MILETLEFVTICYGAVSFLVNSYSCAPVVQINETQVTGRSFSFMNAEVYEYLSIPYAEPPVGQLRFKKTQPLIHYPDTLNAVNVPPACHQFTEKPFPWYINSSHKSEDCLYLNIWTPSDAAVENKKAVMYWIYGGAFRYDSISSELYSGIALAALGDIIVVTVNYRVGPLGFLTSGTEDAPGNAGVWDVLEGLRWVNRNIKFFGGDPSKITIAGESSGSILVGLLGVSPLSENLYSRQIMESGSPTYLEADNNTQNLAFSQQVAKLVGCATNDVTIQDNPGPVVECLKSTDPVALSVADSELPALNTLTFVPQYGDEILPENPRRAIFKGKFRCSELLIGNNKDEGSFALTSTFPEIFGFFGEKNPQINTTTATGMMLKLLESFPDPEAIVKHYLSKKVPENAYDFPRHQAYTSGGDALLLCPDVYHAEKCAKKGSQVYYYFWTHRPSTTPWAPWMGVAHFSEVQFVFGQPLLNPDRYEAKEPQISRQLIEIWTSFVKDGKPSIPWPLYSKKNPCYKFLGPELVTGKNGIGPHKNNCDFFRPFFKP